MSVTAIVSNVSRGSLHDGPGVRTVVYLKGCALRCRWCHNPEALSVQPQVMYAPVKCIHCGRCIEICPEHHRVIGDDMVLEREGCAACGKCAENCPSGALSMSGTRRTLDEVWKEVMRDRHYYQTSGGGITLSGGECLLQADFAAQLLARCREAGVHTAVETALFVPWESIEKVLPVCDLFLCDFKIPDPEKHRAYTGQDNRLILQNFHALTQRAPGRVLLRIPLIPGVNDSEAEMLAFAEKIRGFEDGLQGIELLKYNPMAESKYRQVGMKYEAFGEEAQSDDEVKRLAEALESALKQTKVRF